MVLGHGRGQIQYVTIGGTRDGKVTHYRLHVIQDCGGFAEMGTILAPFMTRPMSVGRVRHPQHRVPHDERRHQHDADHRVPRRRPPGGHGGSRADRWTCSPPRSAWTRSRCAARTSSPSSASRTPPSSGRPTTSATTRARSTRRSRPPATPTLRAEQAARRARGDPKQLGIGVSVYVEITGGVDPFGEHAKIEVLDDGRRESSTPAPRRTARVTSPSWSMLAHEQTGIPMDKIDVVWGDTDLVPNGARHDGLALAAAGRRGRVPGRRRAGRRRPQAGRQAARGRRGRRRARQGQRLRSTSPARQRSPKSWAELARSRPRATPTCPRAWRRDRSSRSSGPTFPFGAHVAVVEVDTETGQVRTFATSRATTPAACSTRCCSRARSTAASPRARRRRCSKRCATTATATRSRPTSPTTRSSRRPSCPASRSCTWRRRPSSTHWAPRASARAARSARRRPCSPRSSTRSATSASATSTCPAPPSACGTRSRRRAS